MNRGLIKNILQTLQDSNLKLLVFGLGYDSKLWYYGNKKNTYFIEDNIEYIELNKDISDSNIIYHDYGEINVKNSFSLTNETLKKFIVPDKLKDIGTFDIIIIDGPKGNTNNSKGRLIPYYWSSQFLSKKNTIIYCDDIERKLESYCLDKFFKDKIIETYNNGHKKSCKIII